MQLINQVRIIGGMTPLLKPLKTYLQIIKILIITRKKNEINT